MTETCHQFDALIARAAQLTPEESARLDTHLAGCGACRELARAVVPVDDDAAFLVTGIAATLQTESGAPVRAAQQSRRPEPGAGPR